MEIDQQAAEASLADIATVVARLKQSTDYRRASSSIIWWGVLIAAGYLICQWMPRGAAIVWPTINAAGILGTLLIGRIQQRKHAEFNWRLVIALVLFFGFGAICCRLGHFGPRELDVFWPILFMFGYALAGLWLGIAFAWLGIVVAALAFAGYLFIGTWFGLYLAVVNGGGMILAGLWMRRA